MNPYSGDDCVCPKCRHEGAATEWQPSTTTLTPWGQLIQQNRMADTGQPGWLMRVCGRCNYRWVEATEDAEVAG